MNTATYQGDIDADGNIRPFRVAPLDNVDPSAVAKLEAAGNIAIVSSLQDAQGVIIRNATRLDNADDFHDDLSIVIRAGVGIDNVNKEHATSAGVVTQNTPGASTDAVARRVHTFALAWEADLVRLSSALQTGKWEKATRPSLRDMTAGIIGFGRIGQEVADRIARDVDSIVVHDPFLKADLSALGLAAGVRSKLRRVETVEELLETSDIVTVHAGGAEEILTQALLTRLKTTALLINTARGGLVNADGLLERMDAGTQAALDVFPVEGKGIADDPTTNRILQHPNFVMGTPHTSASDEATQREIGLEAADRMISFAQQGAINPTGLPGLTLPRIDGGEKRLPGVRAVLTHQSKAGTIESMTAVLKTHDINITGLTNSDQQENGHADTQEALAGTIIDMSVQNPVVAAQVLQEIRDSVDLLRARLLMYT